jgi:hypothetical protein
VSARALFAFYEHERDDKGAPSIRARVGALLLAEHLDNARFLKRFAEAYAEGMKKSALRGKRRR